MKKIKAIKICTGCLPNRPKGCPTRASAKTRYEDTLASGQHGPLTVFHECKNNGESNIANPSIDVQVTKSHNHNITVTNVDEAPPGGKIVSESNNMEKDVSDPQYPLPLPPGLSWPVFATDAAGRGERYEYWTSQVKSLPN